MRRFANIMENSRRVVNEPRTGKLFVRLCKRDRHYCITVKRARYAAWLVFASSTLSYGAAWNTLCEYRPECRSLLA